MFTQPVYALSSIKTLAFQQTPITLTAGYKGLLFDERINPLKVGPDQITFSLPRPHVRLILCEPLHLHSRALPESVHANIASINLDASEMTLNNFRFSGLPWRDRYEQRVQPASPLTGMLTFDHRIVRASLLDLSVHGVGVMIEREPDSMPDPKVKSSVDVNIQLDSQTRLSMPGETAYIRKGGTLLLNLGLRLSPTTYQESILESFVARRKVQIMCELQQLVREKNQSTRNGGQISIK